MKRNEYTILKRQIPDVHLHSITGSYWFDNQNNLIPWSGDTGFLPTGYTPYSGYVVNNVTGSLPTGSYIWNGTSWSGLTGSLNQSYNLPIVLEADADEMGVMSSFDGNMEQVEQLVNFTYKVSGSVVTVYSTVNPDKLRKIVNQDFTVDWGVKKMWYSGVTYNINDIIFYNGNGKMYKSLTNSNLNHIPSVVSSSYWNQVELNISGSIAITGSLDSNGGVLYSNFPTASFDYTPYTSSYTGSYVETYTGSSISSFDVSVYLNSPWSKQKMTKTITLFDTGSITDNVNVLGTFSGFTIPYTNITGSSLNYLNDYEYSNTGYTATPAKSFKFMAIGISKIGELRKYGESTVSTSSYTTGSFSGSLYSGYTLPNDSGSLYYMDLADGYTIITGSVSNYRFGQTSGYTYEISGNTINTVPYLTTSGNTTQYATEYVINHMLTRNEHFIGFIDDPTVYSDIFVERGRQGVMEPNLRLGEIDNMSELEVYGNGYFKVRKQ